MKGRDDGTIRRWDFWSLKSLPAPPRILQGFIDFCHVQLPFKVEVEVKAEVKVEVKAEVKAKVKAEVKAEVEVKAKTKTEVKFKVERLHKAIIMTFFLKN